MSTVIKVEDLSKVYQIGQIGTGTISKDVERWWATRIRGKEDPFLKIGETNDHAIKGKSNIVWSLKDINFEIQQGNAVGIIGRNGAGKSTLLKILSEVTSPTRGKINIKGRVASLLEVGTGFHPELTGKENIYLNGAILGMRKKEIDRKLDEIIDFSGVEKYIDTPVKRYSSGMYVRLAFAVAAHLEPEILIVDEVLAVGDAQFQKKCLGKMKDVSGQGRTVLFVSHNLHAVSNLCTSGLLLNKGGLDYNGNIEDCIKNYIVSSRDLNLSTIAKADRSKRTNGNVIFEEIKPIKNGAENWEFDFDEDIFISFKAKSQNGGAGLSIYMALKHPYSGEIISNFKTIISKQKISIGTEFNFSITIPKKTIRTGQYSLYFALGDDETKVFYDVVDENVNLPVLSINPTSMDVHENSGFVSLPFSFKLNA